MNLLANWAGNLAAIATAVLAIIAIITFALDRTKFINAIRTTWPGFFKKRYLDILRIIFTVIIVILIALVYIKTKQLPDSNKVVQTATAVGYNIAEKYMASLRSRMDDIVHTIINFQKDPKATRNRIYEKALRQAADKGYIFYIPQKDYYITAMTKREDKYHLTKKERNLIKNSLEDIFKRSNERDQINLMSMILSDIRVTDELWKPKKRLVDLSPIDIIGIVGGYIGELILEK